MIGTPDNRQMGWDSCLWPGRLTRYREPAPGWTTGVGEHTAQFSRVEQR
jgi:hypothetical protein